MERLTERDMRCPDPKTIYGVYVKDSDYIAAARRLADYEDTGLMPEEVSALVKDWSDLHTIIGECGGIDRLRELAGPIRTVGWWRRGGGTRTKLAHYAERSQRKDWTQRSGTIGSLTIATTAARRWTGGGEK